MIESNPTGKFIAILEPVARKRTRKPDTSALRHSWSILPSRSFSWSTTASVNRMRHVRGGLRSGKAERRKPVEAPGFIHGEPSRWIPWSMRFGTFSVSG